MNLSDLFAIPRERDPQRTALSFRAHGDAPVERWSFAELHDGAGRLAAGLHAWGLRKGDRVAFFAGNSPQFVLAYLAVVRLGGVVVPINTRYRHTELTHILADCGPRLLFTERALLPLAQDVMTEDASIEATLLDSDLATWMGDEAAFHAPVVDGDDLALILYTSGTTGRSKGAMLSHNAILATVTGLLAAWRWEAADRLLLVLPLFHTHGLIVGLHCALAAGAETLLRSHFDAEQTVDSLILGEATCFFGVPSIYTRLVGVLEARTPDERRALGAMRLFCSGSAPLAPELFDSFHALTGHSILERYGMTETGMNLSNPYAGPRIAGSVGISLPGVSARIVRVDAGEGVLQEVAPGEEGELVVRGANLFSGYWNAPGLSADAFCADANGRRWFRTGDLARRNAATGYVTLLGRTHDLIISGGFNIYPREIEETLERFAGVKEAAVIGVPDDAWGERPEAWIVCSEGVDDASLERWCRSQLAGYKCPKVFHRIESLPRNAMGKVQKRRLTATHTAPPADDHPTMG